MEHTDAGLAWEILLRYADPATTEFDSVVEAAALPAEVARALRFWHRESIANVKQFAAEVLPTVFEAIGTAQRDASAATRRAGVAYGAAALTRNPEPSGWDTVVTLPERSGPSSRNPDLLEERRRTVAARLAELG